MNSGASDLQAEVITQPRQLNRFADGWNELLADSLENSIFLTWQWIRTWLDVVYPQASLLTVVVSQGGRFVAIAPFYVSTLHLGGLPFSCLRIIGDRHSGAEYGNLILRRGYETEAIQIILRTLLVHRNRWHLIWMPKVAGWNCTCQLLGQGCAQMNLICRTRPVQFPSVTLGNDYEQWMGRLSKQRREYLRRVTRKLFARHDVQHVGPASPQELPQYLEALFQLHNKRWAAAGKIGSFDRSCLKKPFFLSIAPAMFQRGWLQVDGLRVDGQIKAVQYNYIYNGALVSVQEGFDPDSIESLGNVLRHLVMQRTFAQGLSQYDFLAGLSPHKQHWGCQVRGGHDLLIGRKCLRSRLLLARPFWPTSRLLREGEP